MPSAKDSESFQRSMITESQSSLMTRRELMGRSLLGIGAGAVLASCDMPTELEAGAKAQASADSDITHVSATEHKRKISLPPEAFELPRWHAPKTGNFDLSDPLDNHLAWMKVQSDVGGTASFLAMYGWLLIAPPGEPAYPFLGRLTLVKTFFTAATEDLAPDVGENDVAIWGTMTTTHVDPRTYKPVERIYNPYIDRTIDVPNINYSDRLVYRVGQSIVVPGVDPAVYDQPWDREGGYSQFSIDGGDQISYVVLGSAQKPGRHQPRCDVGFWNASRADLMDPGKTRVKMQRDYSVIQKLTEYAWYGAPENDEAQLFGHLTGWGCNDAGDLPAPVKSQVYDRFGDRFTFS